MLEDMTKAAAEKQPHKLATTGSNAPAEARTQADEYESLFGTTELKLDNGDVVLVPPHPDYAMLDDDQMEAYDDLLFEMDTEYDREPDIFIPEQRLLDKDGHETGVVLPAETQRGALKRPYRKNNERIRPTHSVRVAQIALGDVEYKRLREGGRSAADVWKIWGEQSVRIRERQQRDSKSAGGTVGVAPVSAPDS